MTKKENIQDLTHKLVAAIELYEDEIKDLGAEVQRQQGLCQRYYDNMMTFKAEVDKLRLDKVCAPTMPVIPKAVAIAIFREGVQHGVEAACTELEGQTIEVYENRRAWSFEVTFSKEIDLDDELDLDWMRDKCGDYSEERAIDALGELGADRMFEGRIQGINDQEEKQ